MTELMIREARAGDLQRLVSLLADDPLGATRERDESPLPASYSAAFEEIDADAFNTLLVGELDGLVVGVLQLTILPSLTYQGARRAQIEGVRVARTHRGLGLGERLITEAIERARRERARIIQLTTDKSRPRALEFYARLGFVASHEGMKLLIAGND